MISTDERKNYDTGRDWEKGRGKMVIHDEECVVLFLWRSGEERVHESELTRLW